MILIVSQHFETSTDQIIEWLILNKKSCVRINENTYIRDVCINNLNGEVELLLFNNIKIDFGSVKSYFYRRGNLKYNLTHIKGASEETKVFLEALQSEWKQLKEYLFCLLEQKNFIGNVSANNINKLKVLSEAERVGLNTPRTFIASNKQQFEREC
ncbi:MAG TPA: hypothetical protein VM802_20380 [Chitinophaga sp.]|uniref:hypothetical protein n=1 Tax=Chitinophaga sp. TaxID=1869181 RepID=UPI002CE76F44|nr:hypothetical protein [Chitinophaga sp.]HVI47246.1 hypothetical protein [Chitinophaga sp.]